MGMAVSRSDSPLVLGSTLAVHVPEAAPAPVAFAASELAHYIARLTGVRVSMRPASRLRGRTAVVLGEEPSGDLVEAGRQQAGCTVQPGRGHVTLSGESPRHVLEAAYALLSWWGCQWSPHGADDEVVPRLETLPVPATALHGTSRFRVTGYAADLMTWHATEPELYRDRIAEDRMLIDWMAKTGANRFQYIRHPVDDLLTIPDLQDDLDRRGIGLDCGGHVIPALVPRDLFAVHPEYFPCGPDQVRTSNGNICTAQPGALDTASRTAVGWTREHAGVAGLHIWGADLWQGGWCRCAACQPVSVQDQSLRLANAVARALSAAGVSCPVYYLAYHDTIDPGGCLEPDPGVWVEFAPRERCYGHALDDPECPTNRRYAIALERYAAQFDGRVRVFEYYADAVLLCGCAVPLTAVIDADLAYFARLGVPEITMLQFGAVSRFAYPLNFVAFAAAAAASGAVAPATAAYCRRFAPAATAVAAALAEVEQAMGRVVRYGDVRRPPRAPEARDRVRRSVVEAIGVLDHVIEVLGVHAGGPVGDVTAILTYTREVLGGVAAACADAAGAAHARYAAAAAQAQQWSRQAAGVWGTVDLPRLHEYYDVVFPVR